MRAFEGADWELFGRPDGAAEMIWEFQSDGVLVACRDGEPFYRAAWAQTEDVLWIDFTGCEALPTMERERYLVRECGGEVWLLDLDTMNTPLEAWLACRLRPFL